MKTVVISPHPDDETLGCGGTLLKHKKNNDELYWIIMTTVTEDINYPDNYENIRNREIEKVANLYGMKDIFKLNFPAAKLDNIPLKNIIGKISRAFKSIKPEQIYLPNRSDIHSDHRVTFDASFSCTKSFRYSTIKKVLMYETLSET
ncbi:MAG: PIG-L deacetylase family protein, partial [bacterium]